ncbi:hypothetical protein SOP89_08640 [Pseudomonas siliginis]|uniref:hypothetical protein n=1 Tax=Pseudomonas siliginis TaxID=2842346 RepID=UPI002B2429E5|nr:hypothetical protein [Pseudomonas siliginis]MEB2651440.1 hypothetical protein [Pseudomonas siliginis]
MNKGFKRLAHHLDKGNPEKSEEYFQNVADLFGEEWLSKNEGHRLQTLWSRKDHLATTELFALGFAINKLKVKHKNWLLGLANNIRRQPANAHGYLAELLVCSVFLSESAAVRPAKKNSPGYDLEIEFQDGFKYLYSIKNHDISQHEKKFQQRCAELKSAFARRVQQLKVHGALRIFSAIHLDDEAFDRLIKFVESDLKIFQSYTYLKGNVQVHFIKLDEMDTPFATNFFSSEFLVISPFHKNELKNQIDRLHKAAENLAKYVPESEGYFRWLWMRVHSSANIEELKKAADELVKDGRSIGVDGVFFIQPSVVRDGSGSQIHTTFEFSVRKDHQGFARSVMEGKMFMNLEFPVGAFGATPPKVHIELPQGVLEVSNDQYFYQSTDYYVKAIKTSDGWQGEMKSPASGVQYHVVVEFDDQPEIVLQGIFPASEELLFI